MFTFSKKRKRLKSTLWAKWSVPNKKKRKQNNNKIPPADIVRVITVLFRNHFYWGNSHLPTPVSQPNPNFHNTQGTASLSKRGDAEYLKNRKAIPSLYTNILSGEPTHENVLRATYFCGLFSSFYVQMGCRRKRGYVNQPLRGVEVREKQFHVAKSITLTHHSLNRKLIRIDSPAPLTEIFFGIVTPEGVTSPRTGLEAILTIHTKNIQWR